MRKISIVKNLLCGTAFSVAVFSTQAAAQESDAGTNPQIEEIVVTAQKRSENLQNVPIAVSVASAGTLASAGVADVGSLTMVTPALTVTTSAGGYFLPRIRGVGQSGTTLSLENPVAVYVDGVYYPSSAGSLFALNNIAQVAVLKGPQGTLFGRNATGGLIQVTTLDPSENAHAKVEATAGSHGIYGGSLYATGPLGSGVAADLAVVYNNVSHGFGKNLFNGLRVGTSKDLAIRSKLKADLGEATTITLAADYSESEASRPAFRASYGTIPAAGGAFTGGKFDVNSNLQPSNRTEQAGGSLTVDHDFGGVKLSSISAYRWTRFHTALDNDATSAAANAVTAGQRENSYTQELQLSSDNSGPLVWTAGLYYFKYAGRFDPALNIRINSGAVLVAVNSSPKTESYAAYAQGTYSLTEQLNFTAGLRWTKETRKASGTLQRFVGGNSVLFLPSSNSLSIKRPTWRLALDYRPSKEVLAYLSYNRGFKSGGFNPTEVPYNAFQPEKIDAYEAGLKLDLLDRRLRLNPSVYYYDYTNLQASVIVNGLLKTQNAAAAKVYGLDLDFEAAVSTGFTINGGVSWVHGRYGYYRNAQITTPNFPLPGNTLSTMDVRGTRLTNTPDWTVTLGAQYAIPMGDNELTLSANYAYNDGFFSDAENRFRQPDYSLFNASARLNIGKTYSLTVWGKNLGNVAYGTQLATSDLSDRVANAPGRTIGLTAGLSF